MLSHSDRSDKDGCEWPWSHSEENKKAEKTAVNLGKDVRKNKKKYSNY